MQVKDIMTKKVITVKPKSKIAEVSALLTKHRIHGLPVTKKDKVVGIITESDFFIKDLPDLYLPSYIDFLKKAEFKDKMERSKKKDIKKLLNAKALDIMTADCITVSSKKDVSDLLKMFRKGKMYTIPVVDNGKLVGIVTQADILKLIKV